MSHALYSTRLYWQRGSGIAKLHGREVPLVRAPAIGAARTLELDYIPEIGLATIQTQTERRRDMTAAEQRECDVLLKELLP